VTEVAQPDIGSDKKRRCPCLPVLSSPPQPTIPRANQHIIINFVLPHQRFQKYKNWYLKTLFGRGAK